MVEEHSNSSLNFIRLLRVVITPSVVEEKTTRSNRMNFRLIAIDDSTQTVPLALKTKEATALAYRCHSERERMSRVSRASCLLRTSLSKFCRLL